MGKGVRAMSKTTKISVASCIDTMKNSNQLDAWCCNGHDDVDQKVGAKKETESR